MRELILSTVFCIAVVAAVACLVPEGESAEPATTTINLTIPTAALPRIVNAFSTLYPIPTIENPENPDEQIPEFTKEQWAKECLRRYIIKSVKRAEQKAANQAAVVDEDPTIVQ